MANKAVEGFVITAAKVGVVRLFLQQCFFTITFAAKNLLLNCHAKLFEKTTYAPVPILSVCAN
jgi:hypothetical protein